MSTARVMLLAALVVATAPASAQQQSGDGFLFGQPSGSVTLRGGFALPTAGGDLFSLATSQFTLNRSDFRSLDGSIELAFEVSPRLDVLLGAGISGVSKGSDSRGYIGSDGLPILQTTKFQRIPITVSARYYLQSRGRSIGHFAWVPSRYAVYVGAGAGIMNYEFDQHGEFVDSTSKSVFPDHFHSEGWAPTGQVLAGVDWSLGPRWVLNTEAKYLSAGAKLRDDFDGYRLDLSGFSTTVGFSVRF